MPQRKYIEIPNLRWKVYTGSKGGYCHTPQLRFDDRIVAVFPVIGGEYTSMQSRSEAIRAAKKIAAELNRRRVGVSVRPLTGYPKEKKPRWSRIKYLF